MLTPGSITGKPVSDAAVSRLVDGCEGVDMLKSDHILEAREVSRLKVDMGWQRSWIAMANGSASLL
jgi:recombinational DNA repair protein RecT